MGPTWGTACYLRGGEWGLACPTTCGHGHHGALSLLVKAALLWPQQGPCTQAWLHPL